MWTRSKTNLSDFTCVKPFLKKLCVNFEPKPMHLLKKTINKSLTNEQQGASAQNLVDEQCILKALQLVTVPLRQLRVVSGTHVGAVGFYASNVLEAAKLWRFGVQG